MSLPLSYLKCVYDYRSIIGMMATKAIQSRYAGSLTGSAWYIINPVMMLLVYWFVFSVGFKVQPVGGVPFAVVFFSGLIPWMTFSESLTVNTNVITENAYLVTKTVFPTEILPVVNLASGLVSHGFMLIILTLLLLLYGIPFSLYNLQFLYYLVGLSVLGLGLGWFFSAMNVFYRDAGQILGIILNVWFWMTPIVWGMDMIPLKYQYVVKLNPMYYIIEGYKFSFIYHTPFWQSYRLGVYFWCVCLAVLILGGLTFRRLKPEFADVL